MLHSAGSPKVHRIALGGHRRQLLPRGLRRRQLGAVYLNVAETAQGSQPRTIVGVLSGIDIQRCVVVALRAGRQPRTVGSGSRRARSTPAGRPATCAG